MRRSDAMAAFKRYNNVQLDGKPMKIEEIGPNIGLPVTAHVKVVGASYGRGRRTVVMTYVDFFFFLTTMFSWYLLFWLKC